MPANAGMTAEVGSASVPTDFCNARWAESGGHCGPPYFLASAINL